ncbi:hypothetical protein HanRHA438_Chr05g0230731 [Helianthus annuus]|nr:hypothetical protein HanIR_Chr05g0238601 [Helianthus annuus]KAJ0919526.1 hypothetical protein HanRHA438_Chr05g0230731 [Helianthus annuus]
MFEYQLVPTFPNAPAGNKHKTIYDLLHFLTQSRKIMNFQNVIEIGGILQQTLKADHTRYATEQAINKCSTVSSCSSQKGHITEGISKFLLFKLTLVASLSKLPLQAVILHLIGTHLHHTKPGRGIAPLSSTKTFFTAFTENPPGSPQSQNQESSPLVSVVDLR